MIINKKFVLITFFLSLCLIFLDVDFSFATVQQPAPTVTNYTYDPLGQRITVSSGTTTTVYPTKNYNTDGTTATKHIFTNGADTATIEGSGADATVHYTTTDALGSSSLVTNQAGVQEELMDYYPFGALRIDQKAGTFNEQRKYIGQEYDAATGLNYLNARYYNAVLGRFISQDSMFWVLPKDLLSDPQQLNSYSYARNNPIIYSDPEGKKAELEVKGLGWIPGAHGFVSITTEPGADLSKYGSGPRYTIGGYPGNGWGGKLKAKINEPGDLNLSESQHLASYPLLPPQGMSVAQYDQKLLESGDKLVKSDLGNYVFTGQPINSHANSGNTAAQVIIDAGGTFPQIKDVYIGSASLPSPLNNIHIPYAYFPAGLGNPIGTPSYAQQAIAVVNNTINSVKSAVTSNIYSAFNMVKSKLHK